MALALGDTDLRISLSILCKMDYLNVNMTNWSYSRMRLSQSTAVSSRPSTAATVISRTSETQKYKVTCPHTLQHDGADIIYETSGVATTIGMAIWEWPRSAKFGLATEWNGPTMTVLLSSLTRCKA